MTEVMCATNAARNFFCCARLGKKRRARLGRSDARPLSQRARDLASQAIGAVQLCRRASARRRKPRTRVLGAIYAQLSLVDTSLCNGAQKLETS